MRLLPLVSLLMLASPPQAWVEREVYLMGTSLRIAVAAPNRSQGIRAIEDAFEAGRRVDDLLSTWRPGTEIARLNQAPVGHPVRLSPSLYAVLSNAAGWARLTGGAFDPAVGSLVDAWDLRGDGRIPSEPALARARAAVGVAHFVFNDSTHSISRSDSESWLDTGGFGKGVALAEARLALLRGHVTSAILNFGGQVLVIGGDSSGADWKVPVAHPVRRAEPAAWLRLRDRSASTSSQSERFVTVSQKRLGHILDPRSGRPVAAWGSVTVVAEDPALADAISTALLVLGPEAGAKWAERRQDLGVLFLIERDGRVVPQWNRALERYLVPDSTLLRGG
ncbi:MAG: FAD:protein FMN transferase [Gemmatimonadales bacterium]